MKNNLPLGVIPTILTKSGAAVLLIAPIFTTAFIAKVTVKNLREPFVSDKEGNLYGT